MSYTYGTFAAIGMIVVAAAILWCIAELLIKVGEGLEWLLRGRWRKG